MRVSQFEDEVNKQHQVARVDVAADLKQLGTQCVAHDPSSTSSTFLLCPKSVKVEVEEMISLTLILAGCHCPKVKV
jgi:hypothetical protein